MLTVVADLPSNNCRSRGEGGRVGERRPGLGYVVTAEAAAMIDK